MSAVADASQLQRPTNEPAAEAGIRATGLFHLQPPADGAGELLRHRFLCRRGSLLLVGNTGIGKSSLITQLMMQWALGVQSLGIEPVRALKSLMIQGENDEMDLIEMRDGVAGTMGLNDVQRAAISDNVLVFHDYSHTGELFINNIVRPLMEQHHPDLLWIDPVLQYLGGDGNDQEVVGAFLRNQLSPIIHEFNCAVVLVHHTVKPKSNQRTSNVSLSAYDAAGSAEFSNWPRAVLSLRVGRQPGVYDLVAGKRGNRLNWRMPDGCTRSYERTIRHSVEPGVICWEDEDQPQPAAPCAPVVVADERPQVERDADRVLMLIPQTDRKEKKQLIDIDKPFSEKRVRAALNWLIANRSIQEINQPRSGKKPAVYLQRIVAPGELEEPDAGE